MKDPMEVLRAKEQELVRVKKEIEALRIAARLLGSDQPVVTMQPDEDDLVMELP